MSSNARQAELRAEREAQEAAEQAERSRKDAEYRYLPKSYRSMDELTEAVGRTQAELIKTLIEDMIAEAREPYNGP